MGVEKSHKAKMYLKTCILKRRNCQWGKEIITSSVKSIDFYKLEKTYANIFISLPWGNVTRANTGISTFFKAIFF